MEKNIFNAGHHKAEEMGGAGVGGNVASADTVTDSEPNI